MTIGNFVSRNAALYPDREALVFLEQRYSWKQLNSRVNRLADSFLALGLRKGDKVALWSENHPACVEANYALAKIGVVYFPVLSRLLPGEIAQLIDQSEARVLIFQSEAAAALAGVKAALPRVEKFIQIGGPASDFAEDYEEFLARGRDVEPEVEVGPDDLYIFLCTGGTTGLSKMAMLSHANAMFAIFTTINSLHLTEKDAGIQVLPLFHVIINNCLNALVAAGAKVVLEPRFDPVMFMRDMHREKVTAAMVVPPFLFNWIAAFPEAMAFDQSHVRLFATAAATFPTDLKRAVAGHFPNAEIFYTYGLTETSGGNAALLNPAMQFAKDGAIGVVNPVLNHRVVDQFGRDVGPGAVGELLLKGPSVIRGYYKRPEETAATFKDGWLHTGDLVRRDEDGFLFFVDRAKEMIKTGGENVFAKEVEDAILTNKKVQEVGVFGLPDEKWGEKIHAAVVLKPGESAVEAEIIAYAKERLPGFKCPKTVFFLPALPRNPSGKVLKYKLKEKFLLVRD
ncbi:MAG: AMP-binding protein [Pseudomonadota bacterium]